MLLLKLSVCCCFIVLLSVKTIFANTLTLCDQMTQQFECFAPAIKKDNGVPLFSLTVMHYMHIWTVYGWIVQFYYYYYL